MLLIYFGLFFPFFWVFLRRMVADGNHDISPCAVLLFLFSFLHSFLFYSSLLSFKKKKTKGGKQKETNKRKKRPTSSSSCLLFHTIPVVITHAVNNQHDRVINKPQKPLKLGNNSMKFN